MSASVRWESDLTTPGLLRGVEEGVSASTEQLLGTEFLSFPCRRATALWGLGLWTCACASVNRCVSFLMARSCPAGEKAEGPGLWGWVGGIHFQRPTAVTLGRLQKCSAVVLPGSSLPALHFCSSICQLSQQTPGPEVFSSVAPPDWVADLPEMGRGHPPWVCTWSPPSPSQGWPAWGRGHYRADAVLVWTCIGMLRLVTPPLLEVR